MENKEADCLEDKIVDKIRDLNPDLEFLKIDGFDDCIIGTCERFGGELCLAYDQEKIIEKLISDGMEPDEALEFFEFNILGSYVGEKTPCFIQKY